MDQHLFEKAAEVLGVALSASPATIIQAYHRACALAARSLHLIEMAYRVLITTTSAAREHAVRLYHKSLQRDRLFKALEATCAAAQNTHAARRDRMSSGYTSDVQRSIASLHLAYGQY